MSHKMIINKLKKPPMSGGFGTISANTETFGPFLVGTKCSGLAFVGLDTFTDLPFSLCIESSEFELFSS